jgi:hypothetical protein
VGQDNDRHTVSSHYWEYGSTGYSVWYTWNNGYDSVGYNDITAVESDMTGGSINGSMLPQNDLGTGTVVLYKTSLGRFGKMLIEMHGPDITIGWTTYNAGGSVYTSGSGLLIRSTWSCDLDEGIETAADRDFWWVNQDGTIRYLSSQNGAIFVIAASYKLDAPVDYVGFGQMDMCMRNDNLFFAWENNSRILEIETDNDPFLKKSWLPVTTVNTGGAYPTDPSICVHSSGSRYVAFTSDISGSYSVKYSYRSAATWSSPVLVLGGARKPRMYLDQDGSKVCAYLDSATDKVKFISGVSGYWSGVYSTSAVVPGHISSFFNYNTDTMHIGYFSTDNKLWYRKIY